MKRSCATEEGGIHLPKCSHKGGEGSASPALFCQNGYDLTSVRISSLLPSKVIFSGPDNVMQLW